MFVVVYCLAFARIDEVNKSLAQMDLTKEQLSNLATFLEQKKKIVSEGEMKEQHLQRLEELGFGNGGVVLKVKHKPTGIIMARKVRVGVVTWTKIGWVGLPWNNRHG